MLSICLGVSLSYFGDEYDWKKLNEGEKLMREENKPGILFISKTRSAASRDLGISMSQNEKLIQLSHQFVMILAEDDEEPEDEKYLPGIPYCLISF